MTTAEQPVLGSILADFRRAMPLCVEAGVESSWFDDYRHRHIYAGMEDLFGRSRPIDLTSVASVLRDAKQLATIGGTLFLDDLVDATPTSAHVEFYVEQLRQEYTKRQATGTLAECINMVKDSPVAEIGEVVADCQDRVGKIGAAQDPVRSAGEVATDLIGHWKTRDTNYGYPFMIDGLQNTIGNLTDELMYLAALPSVGKTALMLQLTTCAGHAGKRSSVRSLESSHEKLVGRQIAHIGQVNTLRLRDGSASEEEWDCAQKAQGVLETLPVRVNDRPATLEQLKAWAKTEKARGAEFLAIDNMKNIRTRQKFDNPIHRFMHLSQELKWLRDDVDLPVLILHHLSQDLKLAWSSEMERDADIIMRLTENEDDSTYPTKENEYQDVCVVDCDVMKNREGMRGGTHKLEFVKKYQTFEAR